jgi:uncharacterized membrane protein YfcA
MPGSLLGTAVNRRLDPDLLLLGFAALVLVAAWRMVTGCPNCTKVGDERVLAAPGRVATTTRLDARRVVAVVAAGTGVGFLTGLFGVGGGFVIVPALTLLLDLNMPTAIGTSLLVIAMNSTVALAARLGAATIDWGITLPFAAAAIAGVLSGARLAGRSDPRRLLRWFAVFLVGVAAYTAIDVLAG